jgi:AAA family ATP:ADP antiporter
LKPEGNGGHRRWQLTIFSEPGSTSVLPLVSLAGFEALAASPSVAVIVGAQVARRVANFALARPAREILFTSSARENRYKAKNFVDTVVYRGGDQLAK